MTCRRVLSSTPLLVRGSETGGDSWERKLTNKNYKYYKLLESSKKVVGPVSIQALVDWRLGVRRWVHWGVHWCEHRNGSWIGWFLILLTVYGGPCGWRNLARTKGHELLVARLWIENAPKFRCWNLRSYPSVECHMSRLVWVLLCRWGVCCW
jgi:hypothetical protein